ncbi:unnamed protein product, partial [Mesorhabditis belari]|uniref:Uncharacterized protein n=1 Tax=Mesorhabditis belari TaxID=2138241 RepID=A0AAF3EFA8_9BILA
MEQAAALIDTAPGKQGYIVNFFVEEPKPFPFGLRARLTSQGDADFMVYSGKQSCFGRDDSLNVSYTNTIRGGHCFNLNFTEPFLGCQKYSSFTTSLYRSMAYLPWDQSNLNDNAFSRQ